ncbi:MAG: caspase family protein [Cytophagaceae bacterium]
MKKTLILSALLHFLFDTHTFSQNIDVLLQRGHSKEILTLTTSADGNYFLTGSADNTVRVYDMASCKIVKIYEGHIAAVTGAVFSEDGYYVASASRDKSIKVYQLLKNPKNEILDKKYEFLKSQVMRTEVLTQQELDGRIDKEISLNNDILQSYMDVTPLTCFSADRKFKNFISCGDDQTIRFWDPLIKQSQKTIPVTGVSQLGFLGEGKLFYTVENGKQVGVYKFPSAAKAGSYTSSSNIIQSVPSRDGKYLAVYSKDNKITVLETASQKVNTVIGNASPAFSFFSLASSLVYCSGDQVCFYEPEKKEVVRRISLPGLSLKKLAISGNDKYLIASVNARDLAVLDISSGQFRQYIESNNDEIGYAAIDAEWKTVLSESREGVTKTEVFSGRTAFYPGAKISEVAATDKIRLELPSSDPSSVTDQSGNLAAVFSAGNIEVRNTARNLLIKKFGTGIVSTPTQLLFTHDGKYIAAQFPNHVIKIFEVATGYELAQRTEGKNLSKDSPFSFSPNDKFLGYLNQNNIFVLWNWKEKKEMRLISSRNGAILLSWDNYYIVSNKGIDLVAFKKDGNIYSFEQFDLYYNRPDRVLQALGYAEPNLVKIYTQAFNKRLKKLGFINTSQGIGIHVPVAEVENASEIPAVTMQEKIKLKIRLSDTQYMLRSVNILVNGVPVYGIRGFPLWAKKLKEYTHECDILLSEGHNDIRISCLNEKGAESYKQMLNVVCDKTKVKPDLYLVIFGSSEFERKEMNLTYAAKDGKDIVNLLSKSNLYNQIHVDSFYNQHVSTEVLSSVKARLMKSRPDDAVVLFFAGHGLLDKNLDYFLSSYKVDFNNPSGKGIPYEKMEDLLDSIPSRKKLLMIDACHSGEMDKEDVKLIQESKKETGEVIFRSSPDTGVKYIGLENSFELMKMLFSDLRRSNGATVISSAGGVEYAMEGSQWKNGVFTFCFLKGLKDQEADLNKDGMILLSEIQEYLQKNVSELTAGQQKPTSRKENINNNWRIW